MTAPRDETPVRPSNAWDVLVALVHGAFWLGLFYLMGTCAGCIK